MTRKPDATILRSVNDLVAAVTRLVENVTDRASRGGAARGASPAASRGAETRAATAAPRRPSDPAEKSARLRSAIRAHWANMSPEARAARVKRMLAGRGLKPADAKGGKGARGAAATPKSSRLRSALKAHWAAMSPKERAERVKKMLAGRGLKPKA
jgi:hypothetical protein